MHAQYDEYEQIDDQYSVHRICQAYQMAKFINLVTDSVSTKEKDEKHLIILAGDLNTSSNELPYRLLGMFEFEKD